MAKEFKKQAKFDGEIEIDESYFGTKRMRCARDSGANGKTSVATA